MKLFDDSGKLSQRGMWLSVLGLMIVFAPVWAIYDHFGYMTQGMFAIVANAVLWLYALQYRWHFRQGRFYIVIAALTIFYFAFAFYIPGDLPKKLPTSFFLWPFVIVTIGIDRLAIKLFVRELENKDT